MVWTQLGFGEHRGKTLPQILFKDPDWFFWAYEKNIFKPDIKGEAFRIHPRATSIRIPASHGLDVEVEYFLHPPTGKFASATVVPRSKPVHEGSSQTYRKPVFDLSFPRKIASYDKLGGKNLIKSLKYYLFGDSKCRMTKERCEEFFDNDANFILG